MKPPEPHMCVMTMTTVSFSLKRLKIIFIQTVNKTIVHVHLMRLRHIDKHLFWRLNLSCSWGGGGGNFIRNYIFHQFFRTWKEGILLIFVHGIKSPNQRLQRTPYQSLVHQYCKTKMKMVWNLWPQGNSVNHNFMMIIYLLLFWGSF